MNHLGKDLKKVTVILKEKYYNGIESVRTFKCESGPGCIPDSIGKKSLELLQMARRAGLKAMRLKKPKNKPPIKIYCDDLEKSINKDGCYDAKGSMSCKACLETPVPKKVIKINKDKIIG